MENLEHDYLNAKQSSVGTVGPPSRKTHGFAPENSFLYMKNFSTLKARKFVQKPKDK